MGIGKLLTLTDLLTPLQTLANQWISSRRSRTGTMRYVSVRPARTAGAARAIRGNALSVKPLRVVRSVDAQWPHAGSRLVISGRMVDVCAELARLADLENHNFPPTATRSH